MVTGIGIVACLVPRGSKLRWREDVESSLARENHALAEASNLLGYIRYAHLDLYKSDTIPQSQYVKGTMGGIRYNRN